MVDLETRLIEIHLRKLKYQSNYVNSLKIIILLGNVQIT